MLKYSPLIILLICALPGYSQLPSVSTDNRGSAIEYEENTQIKSLYEEYARNIGSKDGLIFGKEYFPYHFRATRKPLMFVDGKHKASLISSGRKYIDIPLQYDTYTDEIVYTDTSHAFNHVVYPVSLNRDIVDLFTLYHGGDTLNFQYFTREKLGNDDIPEGFFEVAYDGSTKYIIRHHSSVHERNGIDNFFISRSGLINTGKGYSKYRTQRQFIKLFGENSDEIKKILNMNETDVRRTEKRQMIKILELYDKNLSSR